MNAHATGSADPPEPFDPRTITRPDRSLLDYYAVVSAFALAFFPFAFVPLYFKFKTLRYGFDDEGVSMTWGILFRREIYLTYRRIQDINVSRTFVQRWFGLASVGVQTASGSAGPEMTIVGLRRPEALRDFLYSKMRGARHDEDDAGAEHGADEALVLLREIRDTLRRLGPEREAPA